MNKREFERLARQEETLRALGFTQDECAKLRRISMTLRGWHELECGTEHGRIQRDEKTGKPRWQVSDGRSMAMPDREAGAKRRLLDIINAEAKRHGECRYSAFIQTDPRGAALYILRPGDIPAGQSADAYYTRGICVY